MKGNCQLARLIDSYGNPYTRFCPPKCIMFAGTYYKNKRNKDQPGHLCWNGKGTARGDDNSINCKDVLKKECRKYDKKFDREKVRF